ncbi:MAG TPA: MerR family transcriptional regulator [Ktedonobacterales bacterium]|nr:MerR family transcriptional regulator [Ktedonobacterales bacterium]
MRRHRSETTPDTTQRPAPSDADFPKYSIAVASDLSGVPQQQLRRMEESGLVAPARTEGKTRRYSDNDLTEIAVISGLSDEGINMSGIRYILQLRQDIEALRAEVTDLRQRLERAEGKSHPLP